MTDWEMREGDCLEVMAAMEPNSVDSIVSDPPYGLAFMGKQWDHGVPGPEFWREAWRVAKPGAYLVAFGGTRTYHRLTCAIEDAGWEIRDCLSWLYGSGFPKSLDVSKAIDKAAGAEREVVGSYTVGGTAAKGKHKGRATAAADEGSAIGCTKELDITAPATDLARQWQGWGTALKPAWEPIILARKPLIGTVAANVAQYGTGGINVDGCRIVSSDAARVGNRERSDCTQNAYGTGWQKSGTTPEAGRWPANVVLDEDAAAGFPESRYFYTAKASRKEREAGLEGMPIKAAGSKNVGESSGRDPSNPRNTMGQAEVRAANHHPTVKPIALMRWLCRLVTPKGGVVLDPFTGSGTTGSAAVLEGFRFLGIEREPEYVAIARKRIAHWGAETVAPSLFDA